MTIKYELAAVAATVIGASGFFATHNPLDTTTTIERDATFVQTDFIAFDRAFRHGRETCQVGLERHRLCFQTSPLTTQLVAGDTLAADVPLLQAEFPVLVTLSAKTSGQKLIRFGRSLALVDVESRRVNHVLHLDAPTYAEARTPRTQDLALGATDDRGA